MITWNGIRSWSGVSLLVWPLPHWSFGLFFLGPEIQINAAEHFGLCSCWRRRLNRMRWNMASVCTLEKYLYYQPKFHYLNYIYNGVTWICHESKCIWIFVTPTHIDQIQFYRLYSFKFDLFLYPQTCILNFPDFGSRHQQSKVLLMKVVKLFLMIGSLWCVGLKNKIK